MISFSIIIHKKLFSHITLLRMLFFAKSSRICVKWHINVRLIIYYSQIQNYDIRLKFIDTRNNTVYLVQYFRYDPKFVIFHFSSPRIFYIHTSFKWKKKIASPNFRVKSTSSVMSFCYVKNNYTKYMGNVGSLSCPHFKCWLLSQ